MGKDIKGKELGKGLSQRKDDKRYVANFYQKDGTRRSQTFSTLQQARTWLADSKYEDAHNTSVISPNMTVNEWYERWAKEKAGLVRPNTMRNYRERYNNDIKPVIGRMKITEVRPIDCQRVLNEMADDGYTVYPGKGKYFDMNMFQVANMGAIYPDDCKKFLETLKKHI